MSFNPDKTEIFLYSNTEILELNFTCNGRTIPITNSHKHLGVTFSSDANWIYTYRTYIVKYLQTPECSSKVKI
jgi:hypothetical protein